MRVAIALSKLDFIGVERFGDAPKVAYNHRLVTRRYLTTAEYHSQKAPSCYSASNICCCRPCLRSCMARRVVAVCAVATARIDRDGDDNYLAGDVKICAGLLAFDRSIAAISASTLLRSAKEVSGKPSVPLASSMINARNWRSDLVHFMPAMMMRLFSTGVEHRATKREML